jgi:hypothetical protein
MAKMPSLSRRSVTKLPLILRTNTRDIVLLSVCMTLILGPGSLRRLSKLAILILVN